jgi:hypothetical protein
MTAETKSRIILTVLVLGAMLPGCYLLSQQAYMFYGLILVLGGLVVLGWLWKPWQRFAGKK